MKSVNYKALIEFAKKNNINYAVINEYKEIDSVFEFNGLPMIDTETFEIPCCFAVERALIMCIQTPVDMTPEDTGESYMEYANTINHLNSICRPQYIAPEGCYIKLMCWCDWSDSDAVENDFISSCYSVINSSFIKDIKNAVADFRVSKPNDVTPGIYATSELETMYNDVCKRDDFDCELYLNIEGSAFTTNHGVRSVTYGNMKLIETY